MHYMRRDELATITRLRPHRRTSGQTPPALADRSARLAIVHDWCPNFRGGERVLARICKLFPNAEVFTLFDFLPKDIKEQYFHDVAFHSSVANRLPLVQKYYRSLFFFALFSSSSSMSPATMP